MSGTVQVDTATGTVVKDCEACPELAAQLDQERSKLKGAERDINAWRVRYEELRRDKEAEARAHELWDPALDLFNLYNAAAGYYEGRGKPKGCRFSAERFWLILPFLKAEGPEMCQRAIIGRCSDHHVGQRKNGRPIHYDEFERIFGAKGKAATARDNFEESVRRVPKDWRRRVEALS